MANVPSDIVKGGLRWFNRRRSLVQVVRAWRQVLPGDGNFGDPMSTVGTSPARVLGRRAGAINDGRLSLLAEVSLAGLQMAEWLGELRGGVASEEELVILFADLSGYSQWALEQGDEGSVDLLRNVDGLITACVEANGGQVVKRLGDGSMAIFADSISALDAAFAAISEVRTYPSEGYTPRLRAGVHAGAPTRIGDDFIGVDVNIAARLCEEAPENEVLISEAVRKQVVRDGYDAETADVMLRGVPPGLPLYRAIPSGG